MKRKTTNHHCHYREYPDPQHHSGLPFLADVFASDNGTWANFVTVNKGGCRKEWQYHQEFHTIDPKNPRFFMCSFPDGSVTLSDRIHRKGSKDFLWSNAVMIIRCPIPPQYHSLVRKAAETTELTISLHATLDLEANTNAVGAWHQSYRDIPICHSEWPQPDGSIRAAVRTKYKMSLVTRIVTNYKANGFTNTLTITQDMVIAWIEYHSAIGFQQFYIFDHDTVQHGVIETWLQPYIERGLVTYVWFPFKDCVRDFDVDKSRYLGEKGAQWRIGQYVVTNAAIRRYAHQTEWMAHWDIDEYAILLRKSSTMSQLLQQHEHMDAVQLTEHWYSVCNGDHIQPGMLVMERAHCFKEDTTPPKSIMKTCRILYFMVHHPYATIDGKPLAKKTIPKNEGFLAHYRRRTFLSYDAPDFSGKAKSDFTTRHDALSEWVPYLKEKVHQGVEEGQALL